MAFNIYFKLVENSKDFQTKATPWRCDSCKKEEEVLLRARIDYDTLILCKKCIKGLSTLIIEREKELKDERNTHKQPKKTKR